MQNSKRVNLKSVAKRHLNFACCPATSATEGSVKLARIPHLPNGRLGGTRRLVRGSAGSRTLTSLRSGWCGDILHFAFARKRVGFTLLEMVVAMAVFSIAVLAATGAMLSVSNARVKAANLQNVQDNIRYALDLMARELRTGSGYAVDGCAGFRAEGPQIIFTNQAGNQRGYCWWDAGGRGEIRRIVGSQACDAAAPLSGENVTVERLSFWAEGIDPGPFDGQPRVAIAVKVRSLDPKIALRSEMELETAVTSRNRDL